MKEEKDLLLSIFGGKAFLKIKSRLDSMGKILFSFVNMENPKDSIDCYMDAEEFAVTIGRECSIKTGERLIAKLQKEKAKGEAYPKAVYISPVGGNATGNNGKPISRYFEISPAAKGDVLFTAKSFPAEKNSTGAFIAVKGAKALSTLRVPCTYNDLRKLGLVWEYLEKDFMSRQFTVANMKSSYTGKIPVETSYVPAVSAEPEEKTTETESTKAPVETKSLTAIENIVQLKEGVKACKVSIGEEVKRLIILTDRIDSKKLEEFSDTLSKQIAGRKVLTFNADVAVKGNDLYLCKFA